MLGNLSRQPCHAPRPWRLYERGIPVSVLAFRLAAEKFR